MSEKDYDIQERIEQLHQRIVQLEYIVKQDDNRGTTNPRRGPLA